MDWFMIWLNGFSLAAQGLLHMAFLCRLTGQRGRAWQFALYLLLLSALGTAQFYVELGPRSNIIRVGEEKSNHF